MPFEQRGIFLRQENAALYPEKNRQLVLEHEQAERAAIEDFDDLFSDSEREADTKRLATLKQEAAARDAALPEDQRLEYQESEQRASALEIIIADQAELNNWFGEQSLITRTTEFDDLANGVDSVVEFDLGEDVPERLALAIDASTSASPDVIAEKMKKRFEKVVSGDLAEVKYFRSQIDDAVGPIAAIPVVIGLDRMHADELTADFAQMIKLEQTRKAAAEKGSREVEERTRAAIKEKKLAMAKHPGQILFHKQMLAQFDMYEKSNPPADIREKIRALQTLINEVLIQKEDEGIESKTLEKHDRTYTAICSVVAELSA